MHGTSLPSKSGCPSDTGRERRLFRATVADARARSFEGSGVRLWLAVLVAVYVSGCAPHLPRYPWIDEAHAFDTIRRRGARVETLASRCRVILSRAAGGSTQLDGVIVARHPSFLRVRAWKLSQPVLDITLTPAGLWLFTATRSSDGEEPASPLAGLSAERLREAWSLAMGDVDAATWNLETVAGNRLTLTRALPPDGMVECSIDRPTLTLTTCRVTPSRGESPLIVTMRRYRILGDSVIPTRLDLRSNHGNFTVLLDDPEVNADLAAGAFTPPRRAIKQP